MRRGVRDVVIDTLLALVCVAAAGIIGCGCHQTPPEQYPDRPLCGATEAYACTINIAGYQKDCTDGKGFYCARCLPTDPALDWCFLDGADKGDTRAGRWYTCVHDCNACTPAEALAVDPKARCTSATPGESAASSSSTAPGDLSYDVPHGETTVVGGDVAGGVHELGADGDAGSRASADRVAVPDVRDPVDGGVVRGRRWAGQRDVRLLGHGAPVRRAAQWRGLSVVRLSSANLPESSWIRGVRGLVRDVPHRFARPYPAGAGRRLPNPVTLPGQKVRTEMVNES